MPYRRGHIEPTAEKLLNDPILSKRLVRKFTASSLDHVLLNKWKAFVHWHWIETKANKRSVSSNGAVGFNVVFGKETTMELESWQNLDLSVIAF